MAKRKKPKIRLQVDFNKDQAAKLDDLVGLSGTRSAVVRNAVAFLHTYVLRRRERKKFFYEDDKGNRVEVIMPPYEP